jgi:hypothetical protein
MLPYCYPVPVRVASWVAHLARYPTLAPGRRRARSPGSNVSLMPFSTSSTLCPDQTLPHALHSACGLTAANCHRIGAVLDDSTTTFGKSPQFEAIRYRPVLVPAGRPVRKRETRNEAETVDNNSAARVDHRIAQHHRTGRGTGYSGASHEHLAETSFDIAGDDVSQA